MGLRINTNIASLQAQHALSKSTTNLNKSLTRLSTGLRINTGSDDVVGLAKSESLRGQIRGISQAKANISNVTGVLGVAEGYLNQLTDLAQQMRETAVQASDGTISASDRTSLSDKYTQLYNEYARLSVNANFNGVRLLDGTFTSKTLQVGPVQGDTITVSVSDARASVIGQVAVLTTNVLSARSTNSTASTAFTDPGGNISFTVGSSTYTVNSNEYTTDSVSYVENDESAIAYVNAINTVSGQSGVTATALANVVTLNYNLGGTVADGLESNIHMIINGVTVKNTSLAVSFGDDTDASTLVGLINSNSTATGVTATIDTTNDRIILSASDGRNIHIQFNDRSYAGNVNSGYNVFGAMTGATANASFTQVNFRGSFKLSSDSAFSLNDATSQLVGAASKAVAIDASSSLSNATLSTSTGAQTAITIADNVIRQLQSRRATIGSTLNRFNVAANELDSRSENLSAAESAIRDADIAEETAKLTQYQILQQAGATVLAQANSAPQIALTLLQNL